MKKKLNTMKSLLLFIAFFPIFGCISAVQIEPLKTTLPHFEDPLIQEKFERLYDSKLDGGMQTIWTRTMKSERQGET